MEPAYFWLVVAPFAAAVALLMRRRPASREASLGRFARRVGLQVTGEPHPAVERALWIRNVATDLGGIAGITLAAAWVAVTGSPVVEGGLWGLVLVAAAFTGAAVGAGGTAAAQAVRRPSEDEPRVARPVAATLSDYVAPVELQGSRVVAVLPGLLLLVAAVVGAVSDALAVDRVVTAGLVTVTLLPLAALAGSEVAGRRLLERPQSAGSGLELTWWDALRARVLRDLVTVPIHVGTYATFGVLLTLNGVLRDAVLRSVATGVIAALAVGLVAVVLASVLSRPQQHFRRRLWPRLDAEIPAAGGPR